MGIKSNDIMITQKIVVFNFPKKLFRFQKFFYFFIEKDKTVSCGMKKLNPLYLRKNHEKHFKKGEKIKKIPCFFYKSRLTEINSFYIILYRKVCTPKGGFRNAENLSAEEAPSEKGAWFQKENGGQKWP